MTAYNTGFAAHFVHPNTSHFAKPGNNKLPFGGLSAGFPAEAQISLRETSGTRALH